MFYVFWSCSTVSGEEGREGVEAGRGDGGGKRGGIKPYLSGNKISQAQEPIIREEKT